MKYIAIGIGVSILVYALFYALYRTLHLRLRGKRTLGTVIGVRKDDTGDGTVFYPTVKFTTDAGVMLELESSVGTSGTKDFFHPGRQVDVLYSSTNPSMFAIVGYDAEVVLGILLMAAFVGSVCYWINTLQ